MKLQIVYDDPGTYLDQTPCQVIIGRAAQSLGWAVRYGAEPDYDWPDALLFNHKWQRALPTCRPRKVLWSFDLVAMDPTRPLHEQARWHGDAWRTLDVMLVRERSLVGEYRRHGVPAHWSDQACWPANCIGRTFAPVHPCDVGFAGQGYAHGGRRELVGTLAQRHDVHVWCHNERSWDGLDVTWHRGLYDGNFGQIVADAKVIIGTNYRNDLDGCWSNRLWEVLGAGGFFLTRRVPGLADVVTDGVHCVMFDTVADAVAKAAYYLAHPAERQRIARQGQTHAWMHHTYAHRLRDLEKLL